MSSQTFHPQASLHLGAILFRDSETPVGVNAYGLSLEDACYALEEEGTAVMHAFQREVFASLKQGETLGTFRGESWRYVGAPSCHESDTLNA
jgi:hypothetical protein